MFYVKSSGLETKNTLFRLGVKLWIGAKLYLVKSILAASLQTSSALGLGSPVVHWVSCRYLGVTISIFVSGSVFLAEMSSGIIIT